jgi:hypothetical protein
MSNYDRLPDELRWDTQWCLAGPDDSGKYKAPHGFGPRGIFKISPTQNLHWRDLETTIEAATLYPPCGIGFMLTRKDSFTCIDLDIKNINNEPDQSKWTPQDQINRYYAIIKAFDSYTERSASGQGYHIWVHGNIGPGCKRDGVEVYSQDRFIVCTGDVIIEKAIEERQELLDILIGEINATIPKGIELVDKEQTDDDQTLFDRAREASNSDKFITLCNGDWSGYPSQSEADLALLSIFAFYSKSNTQCRRMFRATKLGERPKATKNDTHINRTLKLIRSREAVEEEIDAANVQASAQLIAQLKAAQPSSPKHQNTPPAQQTAQVIPMHPQAPSAAHTPAFNAADYPPDYHELPEHLRFNDTEMSDPDDEPTEAIAWPPGLCGEVARYIYEGSPRPVKEVSIVSALGLFAGVCGKAYNIPQSGLNLYIVLVAKSAIGKEAMHSGIAGLMSTIGESIPNAMNYVDFTDYASGPGLSKAVAMNQSFVNVSGEWGRKLRRLGQEDGRDGPMQQLRTVMTNLYQKSGPKSIVGGIGYSDKEKNIASVSGVAYSMIGETTPDTFYDALTDSMMADGFLSRFTVVEYNGKRPPANTNPVKVPHQFLIEPMCSLVTHASDLNSRFVTQEVVRSPEAAKILNDFDLECDTKINSSDDEGYRQMWNRAHLKTYRIAALLAVADNHTNPIIMAAHAEWALMLIRKDIAVMSRRINSGDVGTGDAPRERKILSVIAKYLSAVPAVSYGIAPTMHAAGIVPRKYLQISTQRSGSFSGHRNGQNAALDATIKSLIDSGYLAEVPKEVAFKNHDFQGKCYRVINLPNQATAKSANK